MAADRPRRRTRLTAAELVAATLAAAVIGGVGTGLGLAAGRVERDSKHTPLKIVRPGDDQPTLNRDRVRLHP